MPGRFLRGKEDSMADREIIVSFVQIEGQEHVRVDRNPAPGPPDVLGPTDSVTWICDPSVRTMDLRLEFDGFFDLSADGNAVQPLIRVSSDLRNGPFASLEVRAADRRIVGTVVRSASNGRRVRWNYHFFDGTTGLQIPWDTSQGQPNSGGVDKPAPPPS
jgi:hypothetical protein